MQGWGGGGVAPAALPAPSRVDLYGFERPEDFDYAAYDEFLSAYLAVLTRRALKWSRLLRGDGGLSRTATGDLQSRRWPLWP